MRNTVSVVAAVVLAGGLTVAVQSPALADVVIAQQLKDRKDDHGWARDSFKRTATIVDTGAEGGEYKVTIADEGTFTTVPGEKSPADPEVMVSRALTGSFTGGGTYTVVGELKNGAQLKALPDSFDDSDGAKVSTANWAKQFFKSGAVSSGIKGWKWSYATLDETMVQEEGKAIAGNITGKLTSKLTVANQCRVSTKDKRNRWTISNVQGDRARTFHHWVAYNGKYTTGLPATTVKPGESVTVTTPHGGRITVRYWDGYAQEKRLYGWSKASVRCS
jgi:hypothetical protein